LPHAAHLKFQKSREFPVNMLVSYCNGSDIVCNHKSSKKLLFHLKKLNEELSLIPSYFYKHLYVSDQGRKGRYKSQEGEGNKSTFFKSWFLSLLLKTKYL
jgi:hypothetical protein